MGRGVSKLLALPFFDEKFRRLVDVLSFHTVEHVICAQAPCGTAFAEKVMELAPALVRCILMVRRTSRISKRSLPDFISSTCFGTWFRNQRIYCSYRRLGC